MKTPIKIVSGGQTGVDRAALEWAVANNLPYGGWCPRGRKAEDGPIPDCFQLTETTSSSYPVRTRWNIRDSGGTAIFSDNPKLTGGTKLTRELVRQLGKPLLHLCVEQGVVEAARQLRSFVESNGITVLNVAGPRASGEPDTGKFVKAVLDRALKPQVS
jgi:hypothetical protein